MASAIFANLISGTARRYHFVPFLSLDLAFQKSENLDSAYGTTVALVGIPFLLRDPISITVMASWHRGGCRITMKTARNSCEFRAVSCLRGSCLHDAWGSFTVIPQGWLSVLRITTD